MSTTFWIQLLGAIFGIAMSYFTYVKFKRKELSSTEVVFWTGGWLLLILVAIIPEILDPIIGPLNFYRRLDFFVVLGFFFLLGIGFYNYSLTKKMEKKIERLVRTEAINQRKDDKIEE
ncbi:DUF2304 domain-containing protein [Candidatus Woesearchaeota archaeon]|jgi:hypothetical protein|nr:DUF2304 domain-containing protein [Candidatus Woesearchaeota archaeon]MBT4110586.1 DUF2304 domain-containing protein [Candidatus Woesearchaeota archaeon]MBT4335890.1 DUF2304 domain-containing protein [Candidatus Woesearchaeota archaeon]MBT4469131.1 DUF2304 domain-containing protein [Candidatus Woesearchaeota archaeon]MBT6744550.1 DUF2304 domain-containing protein [Candidatus Woesearchaeota archaeon]